MIQEHVVLTLEKPSAVPTITFRPESQRSEVWWATDRGPAVCVLLVGQGFLGELVRKVDKKRAVRAKDPNVPRRRARETTGRARIYPTLCSTGSTEPIC